MKKITGIMFVVLALFAMGAQAATSTNPLFPSAEKPMKVGDICIWQSKLISDAGIGWNAEKCVPGVPTTSGKGQVTLNVFDGVILLYPHFGKPSQTPSNADQVRVDEGLFGGRNKVKAWAAKNGVPIYDPLKQL